MNSSRSLILLITLTLSLTGCTRFTHYSSHHTIKPVSHYYHVVRKGDTLYSIAWQSGNDYRKVAAWNNIRWPYRIHPGQRIALKPDYSDTSKRTSKKQAKRTIKSQSVNLVKQRKKTL